MKAWLITWEAAGSAAEVADKIAAVISARRHYRHVEASVEFLYATLKHGPAELLEYARQPTRNPYLARSEGPWIVCGDNPWLYARVVSNIKVEVDRDTGLEMIAWIEPDRYEGPHVAAKGVAARFQRRIKGPLSGEQIWDRSARRFKPGWGPGENPSSK